MERNSNVKVNHLWGQPEIMSKKVSLITRKTMLPGEDSGVKRKFIGKMSESNTKLEQDLNNLTSTANCAKDNQQVQVISCLVKEMESLDHQIKTEKAFLADLKEQIQQAEIQKYKIIRRGVTRKKPVKQASCLDKAVEKSKEIMQEKLHVESVHLSNAITNNAELREKIRVLITERKNFNKDYNNLLDKLKSGKTIMEDLVVSIQNVFLMKKNLLAKMEQMKAKEKKQTQLQEEEACSLQAYKENELRIAMFELDKTKYRQVAKEDENSKKVIMRRTTDEAQMEAYYDITEELFNMYGMNGFLDFLEYDRIIRMINKDNSEIMPLVNCVTQLNHQVEALREQLFIKEMEIEEKSLKQEENRHLHKHKTTYLNGLREHIEEEYMRVADDVRKSNNDLHFLFAGIQSLIQICGADISPLLLLLGENDKVTKFNYNLFLRAIETKVMAVMRTLDLPKRSIQVSYFSLGGTRTKIASQKVYDGSIEDKKFISTPCPMCFPPKRIVRLHQ